MYKIRRALCPGRVKTCCCALFEEFFNPKDARARRWQGPPAAAVVHLSNNRGHLCDPLARQGSIFVDFLTPQDDIKKLRFFDTTQNP